MAEVYNTKIKYETFLLAILVIIFAIVIIRTAWICDDAYITFRTVDNFVNGYGLTWNTAERVQVYTHPLWMFLLSAFYFFTHEIYFTSISISIALSLFVVIILGLGVSRSWWGAAIGIVAAVVLPYFPMFLMTFSGGMESRSAVASMIRTLA